MLTAIQMTMDVLELLTAIKMTKDVIRVTDSDQDDKGCH